MQEKQLSTLLPKRTDLLCSFIKLLEETSNANRNTTPHGHLMAAKIYEGQSLCVQFAKGVSDPSLAAKQDQKDPARLRFPVTGDPVNSPPSIGEQQGRQKNHSPNPMQDTAPAHFSWQLQMAISSKYTSVKLFRQLQS